MKKAVKKRARPKKNRKRGLIIPVVMSSDSGAGHKSEQNFSPPQWAPRYVMASLDAEVKATISARCEATGISRTTFYEHLADSRFVTWLNDELTKAVGVEGREVRTALLRECMKGDLEAIKLWHQLYGDFIPTERRIIEDGDLSGLSNEQLFEIARGLASEGPQGTGPKVH